MFGGTGFMGKPIHSISFGSNTVPHCQQSFNNVKKNHVICPLYSKGYFYVSLGQSFHLKLFCNEEKSVGVG